MKIQVWLGGEYRDIEATLRKRDPKSVDNRRYLTVAGEKAGWVVKHSDGVWSGMVWGPEDPKGGDEFVGRCVMESDKRRDCIDEVAQVAASGYGKVRDAVLGAVGL